MKITEKELAKAIVDHLKEWQWEVYQEVQGIYGRCDIVAKRENILWAIECKTSFGLAVLEQACHWKRSAHYVSVAVPKMPNNFGESLCRQYEIGVLVWRVFRDVTELVRPKLHRHIRPIELHEEQKDFCEAGSSGGGQWTPFKKTVRNLISEVNKNPGIEFNKLITNLEHHYASNGSAKSCLRGFIGSVIPELRTEIINRKLCVFPAQQRGV